MVILNLPPEVEERLQKNAAEAGLTPEQYLIALLERPVVPQRRIVAGGNDADSSFSEAEPRNLVDSSRQMAYSSSSTIVRQGSSPQRSKLLTRLNAEMDPGEELLWAGSPICRPISKSPLFVTGNIFMGLAVGFGLMVPISGSSLWLIGCGSFIAVVLLFLLVHALQSIERDGTIYGVSDRRALILRSAGPLTVRSIQPHEMGEISRTESTDGAGRVAFARQKQAYAAGNLQDSEVAFDDIPNAKAVERLLRTLSNSASH